MISAPAILIPVYNDIKHLPELLRRIPNSLKKDLIFINDGSTDGTESWLKREKVKALHFPVNRGKGAALKAGIEEARRLGYQRIVHLDSDLQHPPEYISHFDSEPGILWCGYRYNRRQMPLHRQFSNLFTSLLISIRTGVQVRDSQCGFRGFTLQDFGRITIRENRFHFESEVLMKLALTGVTIRHVRIPTIYEEETSAIHPIRDTWQFVLLWFRSYFWT